MSDKLTVTLYEPQQAHLVLSSQIWPRLKAFLMAGTRMIIELRHEKRSDAENRLLHAMLTHISKTMEWAGKRRDVETWKRLLVAAWCRAIGEQVELLPALDGHGVDIVFRRTSQLTRGECAELIEFIFAWGSHNDITFPERPEPKRLERVDDETGEILEAVECA